MRRVIGRQQEPLTAAQLEELAAPFERVVVDVATGSGRAVLRRARRQPDALVVGIDAVAENMRAASHRASRTPARGGVPNAVFVAAAADELPGPLAGRADEATVVLPWGSLLRSLLEADADTLGRLRGLLSSNGRLELLLSVAVVDTVPDSPPLDQARAEDLAARLALTGLSVDSVRLAEESDVDRYGSDWARRLGIPRRRQAWVLAFREPAGLTMASDRV